MTNELLEKALVFYACSPDGQYDLDVVVPLIAAELKRRAESPQPPMEIIMHGMRQKIGDTAATHKKSTARANAILMKIIKPTKK